MFHKSTILEKSTKRPSEDNEVPVANKKIKSEPQDTSNAIEKVKETTYLIAGKEYDLSKSIWKKVRFKGDDNHIERSVILFEDVVIRVHKGIKPADVAILANIENEMRINILTGLHIASLDNVASEGKYITVEKLMPGKEMMTLLDEQKKNNDEYPLAEKLHIALKMIAALENLHKLKVLHRDIKLENILYCKENDEATFIDFELAMIVGDDLKGNASFEFTPGLVPPELTSRMAEDGSGYEYSYKTDIYLLGFALAEWLNVVNQLSDTPRATNSLFQPKQLSADLEKTIPMLRKMLNDIPEERPELADIAQALQSLMLSLAPEENPTKDLAK